MTTSVSAHHGFPLPGATPDDLRMNDMEMVKNALVAIDAVLNDKPSTVDVYTVEEIQAFFDPASVSGMFDDIFARLTAIETTLISNNLLPPVSGTQSDLVTHTSYVDSSGFDEFIIAAGPSQIYLKFGPSVNSTGVNTITVNGVQYMWNGSGLGGGNGLTMPTMAAANSDEHVEIVLVNRNEDITVKVEMELGSAWVSWLATVDTNQ